MNRKKKQYAINKSTANEPIWENENFILNNGDSLNVLKKSGLVFVRGEVNVPSYITFKKGQRINYYIKKAGGFSQFADKNNVYIIYPNGISAPAKGWRSEKITEGSTIFIESRKISAQNNDNFWQSFAMISSQAANIATTILSLTLIAGQQ